MDNLDGRVQLASLRLQRGQCSVPEALDAISSGLSTQLHSDLTNKQLNDQWGHCRARDVPEVVLAYFREVSGNDYSTSRAPSGIVHTYGYLLSDSDLPFQMTKRYRWTSGAINSFFGDDQHPIWSGSKTFLSVLTSAISTISDGVPVAEVDRSKSSGTAEVARLEQSNPSEGWCTRWQVFGLENSAVQEVNQNLEAHLLVYRVGAIDSSLLLSTVFPVRHERIDELRKLHLAEFPTLRFNACWP